jgi:EAL domain-containing protein (putative c-di-GMP-specific phosphodiesterase class I)
VASDAELELLVRAGCDQAQGELVAMAMPGDTLARWILANAPKWRERLA